MKPKITYIHYLSVFISIFLYADLAIAAKQTSKELCDIAENMIENNVYEAQGSTQKGMEMGIKRLKEAIALGCPEQRRAMLILADSYDQMPNPPATGTAADQSRIGERNELLKKLYKLYPDDIEVLQRYATRVANDEERIDVYKRIIQIDYKKTDAHYLLSVLLLRLSGLSDGVNEAVIALQLEESPSIVRIYVSGVMDELIRRNCNVLQNGEWENQFLELEMAMLSPERSISEKAAVDLKNIKNKFIEMLRQTHCENE